MVGPDAIQGFLCLQNTVETPKKANALKESVAVMFDLWRGRFVV